MSLVVVTPDEERERVRVIVKKLARLLAPDEDKKIQRGKIAAMTGIPARRMKDLALGAVNEPPSHQVRTLENALKVARALAPSDLDHEEMENERDRLIAARPDRTLRVRGAGPAWSRGTR